MDKEKVLICVLCGHEWGVKNPCTNRCENENCHGFCSWGYELAKPESFNVGTDGKWTCKHPLIPHEDIYAELKKRKESPYYFATKYMTVNGKPFETLYSEEGFNFLIKAYENDQ